MTLLQRYIMRSLLMSMMIIFVSMAGIDFFISLVNEFGDIGKGDYSLGKAFFYVLLNSPYHLYQFSPMLCLLASLTGLGVLASQNELIVMRASGLSIKQLSVILIIFTSLCVFVMTCLGETAVPHAKQMAEEIKIIAKSGGQALKTNRGFWLRQNDAFIHVRSVLPNEELVGVSIFNFDAAHRLVRARFAERAHKHQTGWLLEGVTQSQITATQVTTKKMAREDWPIRFNPNTLAITLIHPNQMTLPELHHYIAAAKQLGMQAKVAELSYLRRLIQPLSTAVMVLLGLPFILGPLRSTTLGVRLLVGLLVGFSFYLLNEFLGPVSLVYQLPPLLAASFPTVLFAVMSYLSLKRI